MFDLAHKTRIAVRALYLGHRIDTRALEKTKSLVFTPLTLEAGSCGCAVLFRYGSVVLFDVTPVEEADFLTHLSPYIAEPADQILYEEMEIHVGVRGSEQIENTVLYLPAIGLEHCQLTGEILARSLVLENYETKVTKTFEVIEPLAIDLKEKGGRAGNVRNLLKHIGDVLINQQAMVGRVQVDEKPDLLWNFPQLEGIYHLLENEYEIQERNHALERKLDVITRTAQTALDLAQTMRSLRVEWYIVILILLEILLTLYDLFIRG